MVGSIVGVGIFNVALAAAPRADRRRGARACAARRLGAALSAVICRCAHACPAVVHACGRRDRGDPGGDRGRAGHWRRGRDHRLRTLLGRGAQRPPSAQPAHRRADRDPGGPRAALLSRQSTQARRRGRIASPGAPRAGERRWQASRQGSAPPIGPAQKPGARSVARLLLSPGSGLPFTRCCRSTMSSGSEISARPGFRIGRSIRCGSRWTSTPGR